jgi:GNAT superfamily N-acetyltransferase
MRTPLEIARLEENRQAVGTAAVVDDGEEIAGGWMTYGGPGSWSNQAAGLGLKGPVTEQELDRLVEFFTSRKAEPKIEVCPFADQSLIDGLGDRGFRLLEFENVLARELPAGEDFRPASVPAAPAPLVIERVARDNEQMVRDFIDVSTSGFRPADKPIDEVFDNIWQRMVEHRDNDTFLALWDGQPVGGGAMESAGEVACFFGTSVLPQWQRRGTQTALIVRRLEQARENGCELAIIHSAPGIATERNALRLGFQVAYTKAILVMPAPGLERSA